MGDKMKTCYPLGASNVVSKYTLKNGSFELSVINWGATITGVKIDGVDVVLGFTDMAGYTSAPPRGKNPYMGAVVGRVANRIANGKFSLDGKEYELAKNNGPNALHGGLIGIDKVLWTSAVDDEKGTVTFSYVGKDGEEGYPGDVLYNVKQDHGILVHDIHHKQGRGQHRP